ncbi:hypothetical protein BJV82DRAFT_586653 [Fennellomyces sp. T-0311]|nr:hypothetical protein BJV82DRAFT_586653 [Fennellomyces sp. T-0311]
MRKHLSMVAGSIVLLLRIKAVLPPGIAFRMNIVHVLIALARLAIGIVDVVLLGSMETDAGLCFYLENSFWGPVYTFYDTVLDIYVTIMIAFFLSRHIHRLRTARTQGNIPSYIGIVMQNVFRTIILSIANFISAIFILRGTRHHGIMIVWPIVNMLFVLLIGYDADLAQCMRHLHVSLHKSEHPPPCTQRPPTTSLECPYCGHRRGSNDTVAMDAGNNRRWRQHQFSTSRTPSFLSSSLGSSLDSQRTSPVCRNFQMSYHPDESVPGYSPPPPNTPASSEIRIKLSPASTLTEPPEGHYQDSFSTRPLTPPAPLHRSISSKKS